MGIYVDGGTPAKYEIYGVKTPETVDWSKVKFFKESDNWGDPNLVDPKLVYALDKYRRILKSPIFLSPVEGAVVAFDGHSRASYHYPVKGGYKCRAADVFPSCNIFYAWIIALKSGLFTGIGLYPYWEWKSKNLRGGLHLDVRITKATTTGSVIWWDDQEGTKHYFGDSQTSAIEKLIYSLSIA